VIHPALPGKPNVGTLLSLSQTLSGSPRNLGTNIDELGIGVLSYVLSKIRCWPEIGYGHFSAPTRLGLRFMVGYASMTMDGMDGRAERLKSAKGGSDERRRAARRRAGE
jgi:hypothetical protein